MSGAGEERGERHRGSEGVRTRDGEGLPAGQEERPEDQGSGHRPRGRGGGGRSDELCHSEAKAGGAH